jgi:hypothetical protein
MRHLREIEWDRPTSAIIYRYTRTYTHTEGQDFRQECEQKWSPLNKIFYIIDEIVDDCTKNVLTYLNRRDKSRLSKLAKSFQTKGRVR